MDLFDIDDKQQLSREAAAEKLRALADSLSRHNSVEFQRDGKRFTVKAIDGVFPEHGSNNDLLNLLSLSAESIANALGE